MVYGFTFEEMGKVNHPGRVKKTWGYHLPIAKRPEYALNLFYLKKGGIQPLHYYLKTQGTLFLEEGAILLKAIDKKEKLRAFRLNKGDVFKIKPGLTHALCGLENSYAYMFSGQYNDDCRNVKKEEEVANLTLDINKVQISEPDDEFRVEKSFDYRDKYWGSIQSLVNGAYAGKRIFLKAGAQNSLEFHCQKTETYFIHSGKLKVGLRLGRGENKSVIIEAGDVFEIPPGLMHMKIGIEDSVVIEISTHDDDRDSHIVEDGKIYKHKEQ